MHFDYLIGIPRKSGTTIAFITFGYIDMCGQLDLHWRTRGSGRAGTARLRTPAVLGPERFSAPSLMDGRSPCSFGEGGTRPAFQRLASRAVLLLERFRGGFAFSAGPGPGLSRERPPGDEPRPWPSTAQAAWNGHQPSAPATVAENADFSGARVAGSQPESRQNVLRPYLVNHMFEASSLA